jgi:hypothetical protein
VVYAHVARDAYRTEFGSLLVKYRALK